MDQDRPTPAELILARCRAFGRGDFAFIYDSYHPESNFRRHFSDREAYLEHGRSTLAAEFEIRRCRILREEVTGEEARVIFVLEARHREEPVESLELAFLVRSAEGWLYQAGQKMERSAYAGRLEEIDFADFERVRERIVF